MSERKQVILLLIATRKYKDFVQSILNDVKKYFLINHDVTVEVFTDEIRTYEGDERVKVNQTLIVSYKFPFASMYRYRFFTSKEYPCDYIYYSDVDMGIENYVGEEIFGDVVAVRHPGFYNGGGSWETNEKSMCYTHPENRLKYYAGGFQGGSCKEYYRMMVFMKNLIDVDEKNNIVPVWHDESAWNFVLSVTKTITELNPSYCMVEQQHLREQWGISQFPAKIVALAKNHEEIRN